VDRAYVDKTFNGQSWFRYREAAVKKTPMDTRSETYAAIRAMLATLVRGAARHPLCARACSHSHTRGLASCVTTHARAA
jgi:hypothetical protein